MILESRLAGKIIKDKDKYYCWAVRPAVIQRISSFSASFHKYILGAKIINFWSAGKDTCYYLERAKYEKASLILDKNFNSELFINKHLANYRRVKQELLAIGRQAKKVEIKKEKLLTLFRKYHEIFVDYAQYFLTTFSVDDFIFPSLIKELKAVIPVSKYKEAVNIISSPTMVFGYQKYQLALFKAKTIVDYRRLIKDFLWVKEYSFQEKLLDETQAREDRKQLIKEGLTKNITKTFSYCRRNKRRLAILLKIIKNKRLRRKTTLVNNYINIKTERIEIYKIFQTDFREFFRKLLVLVKNDYPGARYEDMISLTNQEIINYLKIDRGIDLFKARKRFARQYVSLSNNGRMEFIYNKELIKKIRTAFLSVKATREIRGNIVSSGLAHGSVKVIQQLSDLSSLKAGQVLVANFTTPEYVPAMKKAVAIITDDGGITCHAAIIARELGRPCIVGTKNATRILKDGDLVEVDADKGTIKILKS